MMGILRDLTPIRGRLLGGAPLQRCNSGALLFAASAAEVSRKHLPRALKRSSKAIIANARLKACSTQRLLATSLVVASLGVAGLVGCSESKPPAQAPVEKVHGVAVMEVQKATVPDVVEATGTVRAALSAQLASQVMGTITRVNVHEGDHVRRGEVLVSIDEAQQQAAYTGAKAGLQASQESIAAADADYSLAESTMKRYQMLSDKKSVSPQEYDEVKTRLAAAQARRDAAHAGRTQAEAGVSQASTAMGFTKVRAPFDGIVTAKLAEPGAMAAPGVPLLVVEDPSRFRLEASVDESKMGAVKLGETVPVVIDALGDQPIEGKVTQIVPVADPSSRTFTVKIDLPSNPRRFARDYSGGRDFRTVSGSRSRSRRAQS